MKCLFNFLIINTFDVFLGTTIQIPLSLDFRRKCLRISNRKAKPKYIIIGEPNVKKHKRIKNKRMLSVEMPILAPMAVQTPNAFISKKY